MNEKFFDLKKDKQDRMINAAFKVFGTFGYRNSSTDDIVREAGISKGLLFHYFESKLGAYAFACDYAVRYLSMEVRSYVDTKETDFFAIYKQYELAKMQVLKNYPYLVLFLSRCATEIVSEALIATEDQKEAYEALQESIDAQADLSIFSSPETGEKIRNIMKYTVDGNMSRHFFEQSFNAEMLYDENIAYLELLQKLVVG